MADHPCSKCDHFAEAIRFASEGSLEANDPNPEGESPLDRLRRILPGAVRAMSPGQHIALEGEASGQVIGVISGLVRCYRMTADGRRHICRFAGPGSIIGLGLMGVQRHSAEAVTPSQIILFRASAIEAAFDRDPHVRAAIIRVLSEELTERERIQLRLGRLTADQRVADFLIELADAAPHAADSYDIPMSRADIADHLGLTIETVSRALHRFDRMKLIELADAHHFRVLRHAKLADFVDGESEVSTAS